MLSMLLPFTSSRTKQVYNHSLIKSHRFQSDCAPFCPEVDVWQYQYKVDGKIITSKNPISTLEKFWKVPDEARIIALTHFDSKEFYYNALLQYLESFKRIKQANNISDKLWGYETFTVRVYVSKRNPQFLEKFGEIKNRTHDSMINELLDLGCEIAYTDNRLENAKKDGTFWRFATAAEQMPKGKRLRYIMRDSDNVLTAVEMYAVADWIKSGKKYHRMHVMPICMGPLTAMLWGGTHTGESELSDFHDLVKNYPYRFEYGDDELFSRDLLWPRLKASGNVLTHYAKRNSALVSIASPYWKSCEEPTQEFCLELNKKSECEDRMLPPGKNMDGAIEAMGLRMKLDDLYKNYPHFFDLDLKNPDRKFIYEAFKTKN